MSDEKLLTRAAAGDKAAEAECVERFRLLALSLTRGYFVQGGDRADIEQEALIGVMKAARSWKPGLEASGASFVALCVRRQLITAVKMATRAKHEPLSRSVRAARNSDNELVEVVGLLPAGNSDPADVAERREELRTIAAAVGRLSPLERRAAIGFVNGLTYAEIAGCEKFDHAKVKWIDNALQRVRRRIDDALKEAA